MEGILGAIVPLATQLAPVALEALSGLTESAPAEAPAGDASQFAAAMGGGEGGLDLAGLLEMITPLIGTVLEAVAGANQ